MKSKTDAEYARGKSSAARRAADAKKLGAQRAHNLNWDERITALREMLDKAGR